MFKRFYPTEYKESVQDIDYEYLKSKNICGLIFDLDNTLAPFDIEEPTQDIIDFVRGLEADGFNVCLVSNNKGTRVEVFNRKLGLKYVSKAGKPKKAGIMRGIELMGLEPRQCVMIGDQMFTDVWVGNRLGIHTILVKPIANRDEFTVKLKRGAEKIVFNMYLKAEEEAKKIESKTQNDKR